MQKNNENIEIIGAKVHNLRNVNVKIPKNKMVVVCGVSGSGKSSLAFDTLYEEGQRRYLEGLSSYVRQFLGGFKKPDVQKIIGLSPTLAINQKNVSSNPRSTVGTITEIYDHLRLLFARTGTPICPNDNIPIIAQTPQEIADKIISYSKDGEVFILGPVINGKKGEHKAVFDEVARGGYTQVRVDGYLYSITEAQELSLDKNKKHTIEVVVGRFLTGFKMEIQHTLTKTEKDALKKRNKNIKKFVKEETVELLEKIRKGLAIGQGSITALIKPLDKKTKEREVNFSENYACPVCGFSLPKVEPRLFSFNSPFGACPHCQGLGTKLEIELDIILEPTLSLEAGAIKPLFSLSRMARRALGANWQHFVTETIVRDHGYSPKTKFGDLSKEVQDLILYGSGENYIQLQDGDWEGKTQFEGILPRLERLYYETDSDFIRQELGKYMREATCPVCEGARVRKEALAVKVGEKNIAEVAGMSAEKMVNFCEHGIYKGMSPNQKSVAEPIIKEIITKTQFLNDVGLDYMTVNRSATTLSVGENQRIRLATQLGSGLSGVVYVLDEPTIGLHPQDTDRLINTLKTLRDLQNTVVVVEHDERVIAESDWVIEIGPGAGEDGGKVVFTGTPQERLKSKTLTGMYLSGKKTTEPGLDKNLADTKEKESIKISGASQFNLKNVNFKVPTKKFVCVAGVSGSGKSTLVLDVFAKALEKEVLRYPSVPGAYKKLEGQDNINKIIVIDQSPIGRTPRSNPATYTGIFTPIRLFYSHLEEAQIRGYGPSYFSFNVKPGRCEACRGEGYKKVEMYFLPDMYVECEVCKGTRFSQEVLDVKYKDKSIADVLNMSVKEALGFFASFPQISEKIKVLNEIGLGYMKLGQPATTLSGGEAQRIKLADELARRATGKTLYVLDEPTVGLHFDDVKKLLYILRSLVVKGNTVLVIEHNLDVLKEADWIVELGPGGGENGGKIIFEGTLDQIKKKKTTTGKYLI